jgi:hypothetical protein
MTMCQSFHRVDEDSHAYAGEPRRIEPYLIDLMRLQFHANRAKHFAAGRLAEDREQAAREMYEIADWARDLAEQFEEDVKEAEA